MDPILRGPTSLNNAEVDISSPKSSLSFESGLFARLFPVNKLATTALRETAQSRDPTLDYHQRFTSVAYFQNSNHYCYELSLGILPEFAHIGWRIGIGRQKLHNYGVDLLLSSSSSDIDIAGVHARFTWLKGAGGFFVVADNKRGKTVLLNGVFLRNDHRMVPFNNLIVIGECVFTLRYVERDDKGEERFQTNLTDFYREVHKVLNPSILPTPADNQETLGPWIVQYPIARGSYGLVHMVTHSQDGRQAAVKRIFRTIHSTRSYEREVKMAQMNRDLRHDRIASPFDIYTRHTRSKAEMARLVSQLDQTYHPSTSEILEECTIFSPLLSGTFRALINSNVSPENRTEFFAQLVDGIAFLHKHGIAHRDIKPDNIAVKSYIPPAAMIIDFGCASTEESILYYDNPGTIPYLAPEQVKGKFHGRPVDSWACALVGTELLGRHTERRVHGGPLLQEYHVWLDQRHDNPLAACCKNMLLEDPAARMAAADAFIFFQQRKPKPGARRLP